MGSVTIYPPRILRVTYRSRNAPRRVIRVDAKVPYSGIFALSETLARALSTNQIMWYRVEPVPNREIAAIRKDLKRWNEALATSSRTSGVEWDT